MKFQYAETAQQYIYELTEILYDRHYFCYRKSAIEYVNTLIDEVEATIHIRQKHHMVLLLHLPPRKRPILHKTHHKQSHSRPLIRIK